MDVVEEVSPEPAARLAPTETALLVVDVQNDYCHADGVFGRAGRDLSAIQAAVDRLVSFIDMARSIGVPVLFVKTHHERWTNSSTWVTRRVRGAGAAEICATGSWGAEFYRVSPAADECVIVKHRYSAFVGTRLPVVLSALGRSTLLIAGVTTNVCVESTVRDAFMRDWDVVLLEDCAAALTKEEHEAAVHNVRAYFGRVLASTALVDRWRGARR